MFIRKVTQSSCITHSSSSSRLGPFELHLTMADQAKQDQADAVAAKMIADGGLVEGEISPEQSRENEIANILSHEKALNGLTRIKKIRPQPGQEFCVIAYFLTSEVSQEGVHGMWFLVGTYPRSDMATERATELIEETGINSIYAMKTCDWQEINDKFTPDRTKIVPIGRDMKLREQHAREYQEQADRFEKDKEISQEIEEEQERELSDDSVEYYTRQWYLAIKNRSAIESMKQQLVDVEKSLDQRVENIRRAHSAHPEHEENWLSILGEKLPKRNEGRLLELLQRGHHEMKDEVFGSSAEDSSDKS